MRRKENVAGILLEFWNFAGILRLRRKENVAGIFPCFSYFVLKPLHVQK